MSVISADVPGVKMPVSNVVPTFEVAEWLKEPLFVQQTVVPGATVVTSGSYVKLTMLIIVSLGSHMTPGCAEEA